MSFVKIWIHAVWTVKNREAFLKKEGRGLLFEHIRQNALSKRIMIDVVNGFNNHIHCLFRLKSDQTIEDIMQLIKGESSFWANKNNLFGGKIGWQKEYVAVGVGESQVERVRKYIENQEQHHRHKTWEEEYREFIEKYNFNVING